MCSLFEPRDSKSFRVGLHDVGGFMPGVRLESGIPFENIRKMGSDGPTRRQELNVHAFLARFRCPILVLGLAPGRPPPLTAVVIFFARRQGPSGSTRHGLSRGAHQRAHCTFSRLVGLYEMMRHSVCCCSNVDRVPPHRGQAERGPPKPLRLSLPGARS